MTGSVFVGVVAVPAEIRGEPGWMAGAMRSVGYVGPRGRILSGRRGLARAATFPTAAEARQHAEQYAGKVPNGRGAAARIQAQVLSEAKGDGR
jgi:hypothetical protein